MGILEGLAIGIFTKWAIGSIGALVVGWILKAIPTGKWSKQLGELGIRNGQATTEFCSEKLGKLWNGAIEPVFVDTIGILLSWISGFIIGLKSDNEEK